MKSISLSRQCIICGEEIIRGGRNIKQWKNAKYCSPECYHKSLKGNQLHFKPELHKNEKILCACGCGQEIPKLDTHFRHRKYILGHVNKGKKRNLSKEWLENVTKSNIEKGKIYCGSNHWNWKGGISGENAKIRKSYQYNVWRKSVYKRDNWTCQECKQKIKHPIAHHIKSFNDYPELRFEVDNGITLCRSCHKQIHKEIGLKTRFNKKL